MRKVRTGVRLTGTESACIGEAVKSSGYRVGQDIPSSLQHLILGLALLHGLPDMIYDLENGEFTYTTSEIPPELLSDNTPAGDSAAFNQQMQQLFERQEQRERIREVIWT